MKRPAKQSQINQINQKAGSPFRVDGAVYVYEQRFFYRHAYQVIDQAGRLIAIVKRKTDHSGYVFWQGFILSKRRWIKSVADDNFWVLIPSLIKHYSKQHENKTSTAD